MTEPDPSAEYTIVNWAPACGARFDSARLLRDHGVQMVRPYVCTKEADHEGMHWDEDAEALWGSDWTAHHDGRARGGNG